MPKRDGSDAANDAFNLKRFISAQADVYAQALLELHSGRKRSHWMWFIFPQIEGLGHSATTQHYAIQGLEEARQYLNHPVLGQRLVECTEAVLAIQGRSISEIFDFPDDLKLKSCMTLFETIAAPGSPFARLLEKYFDGERDERTLQLLKG